MEQMVIDLFSVETLPEGYLPCSNPELVEGYIAISDVFKGYSVDFYYCDGCGTRFCDCNMDDKRSDRSFPILLDHFRNGGAINQPIDYRPDPAGPEYGEQGNGHHRLIAAYDAGFTHIPYCSHSWGDVDWHDTPNSEGMSW